MNPGENEKLGLGLNLIEALNIFNKRRKVYRFLWVRIKVQRVINLMDEVLV